MHESVSETWVTELEDGILTELHQLIDCVFKIPDEVVIANINAAYELEVCREWKQVFPEKSNDEDIQRYQRRLDELCASVPHIPRKAVTYLSMVYGGYGVMVMSAGEKKSTLQDRIQNMMTVKSAVGMTIGLIGDTGHVQSIMKSISGRKGGKESARVRKENAKVSKHVVKDWLRRLSQNVPPRNLNASIAARIGCTPEAVRKVRKSMESDKKLIATEGPSVCN